MRIVAILVSLIVASGVRGQGADEARKLMAKAVEAHGGEEAILKFRTAQVSYAMWTNVPGVEIDAKVEETYQLPKQMKKVTKGKINGSDVVFVWVVNGGKYWYRENQEKTKLVDKVPDLEKGYRPFLVIEQLIYYQDKEIEVLYLGEKLVAGRALLGIHVKGGVNTDLYFDKKTGLLAKTTHKRFLPRPGRQKDDKETVQEASLSDFRVVNGAKLPHLMTTLSNGKKTAEVRISDVKVFEKLDDSVFAEP